MMMMLIIGSSIQNLEMVLLVVVHGLEMETRRRFNIEVLRAMGIGRETGIETVKRSIEGRETETGMLKEIEGIKGVRVNERRSALSEAKAFLEGMIAEIER
jgi:hypothetical protein